MALTGRRCCTVRCGRPGDRENALSWLSKAADAWRAAQSDGALASPDRREMRQVEEALTRIERR